MSGRRYRARMGTPGAVTVVVVIDVPERGRPAFLNYESAVFRCSSGTAAGWNGGFAPPTV